MPSSPSITVAAVQMTSVLGDKQANLQRAASLLASLDGRAQIACLPEMFNTGYNLPVLDEEIFALAETIPGETTTALAQMARENRVAIVAGIVERDEEVSSLLYDTVVLLDEIGELAGVYRKTHLYPAENGYFTPGNRLPVFTLAGVKVAVATCFEHAFPQIFTTLALRGAQVVFNPSAVPVGYGYLQDVRIPARAQDNQLFVVAVNHVGSEGDVTYCGGSQIADPRGDLLARASDSAEDVITAELPFQLIWDQRRQEPIFRGFRPELYRPRYE